MSVSRRTCLLLAASLLASPAWGRDAPDKNLFLQENGARVAAFSSEFGSGWEVSNLTPSTADFDASGAPVRGLIWSSGSMAPFPHWALLDLGRVKWITTLVFDNYLAEEPDHPGISARDIEIWAGREEAALSRIASFQLERNRSGQTVQLRPVEARFVRLVVKSNYGHPWYTEAGATRAYDDGSRPVSLAQRLEQSGASELQGVYFDFGSSRLRPESQGALAEAAAVARQASDAQFIVEGHTDSVGFPAANKALSQARASQVVAELARLGVPRARLIAEGRGDEQPVADNATDAGRARNRRVVLRVRRPAP